MSLKKRNELMKVYRVVESRNPDFRWGYLIIDGGKQFAANNDWPDGIIIDRENPFQHTFDRALYGSDKTIDLLVESID